MGKNTNAKLLWHGTRKLKPDRIYRGNEGFDISFAREGLWGKGLYFATKASYSDDYCYHNNKTKGLLLSRVICGHSEEKK
jgi:hypothetical protein